MEKINNPFMKKQTQNGAWLFLLIIISLMSTQLHAQVGAERISNNLFNGTASINIPLVSKSVDGVNGSVSMSYHTGGIRMNRIASSMGLGWEMSTASRMTRSIKGKPDEVGYWHRTNSNLGDLSTRIGVADGTLDGESDLFSVVVGGQQVSFMFDCNNHIETFPMNSKLKVERVYNGNVVAQIPATAYTSLGFKITDAGGNQFFFIEGNKAKMEFSNYNGTNITHTYPDFIATDWVIEKVVTYNGREINYTYNHSTPYNILSGYSQDVYYKPVTANTFQVFGHTDLSNGISTMHCIIKTIDYPDLKVTFDYLGETTSSSLQTRCDVPGTMALERITVEGKKDLPPSAAPTPARTKRYIWFDVAYFVSNPPLHNGSEEPYNLTSGCTGVWNNALNGLRLKLRKIQTSYSANPLDPKRVLYDFDYHDIGSGGIGQTVPIRITPAQDYWGYYNNEAIHISPNMNYSNSDPVNVLTSDYVPSVDLDPTSATFSTGQVRTADDKNKIFTLKKLKNEAGGVTEFTYGLNSITIGGNTMNLDGLRLDKIKTYDENHTNLTAQETHYTYENIEWLVPTTSYPSDIKDLFRSKIRYLGYPGGPGSPPPNVVDDVESVSNHSLLESGAQHGYGKVTVMNKAVYQSTDGTSTQTVTKDLGKTEHFFSNLKSPSSNIQVHSSATSTESYTATGSANYNIENFPPHTAVSVLPATSITATDVILHGSAYDEDPYSNKDYAVDWAVGLPIKKIAYMYDSDNSSFKITKESEMYYDVYIEALNTEYFLQLSAKNTTKISTAYGVNTPSSVFTTYKSDYYFPMVGKVLVKKSKKKSYLNPTVFKESESEVFYNAEGDVERSVSTPDLSVPTEVVEKKLFYSYDWTTNTEMIQLAADGVSSVVYRELWRQKTGEPLKLVSASGAGFGDFNGKIRTKNKYSTVLSEPSSSYATGSFNLANANAGSAITDFEQSGEILKYDQYGNALEATYKGLYSASIFDEDLNISLASVNNAQYNEVAYCGFESTTYGSLPLATDYKTRNKGNWNFDHLKVSNQSGAYTGLMGFDISGGNGIWTGSNIALKTTAPAKKYVLTYWVSGSASISVKNGEFAADGMPITSSPLTPTLMRTVNGWSLYRVEFAAAYTDVSLSGTGIIDELRLHPLDAQMSTTAVKPLLGVVTVCDGNNRTIHYEYDEWGRLLLTKDEEGNILSKKKYGVQAND